MRRAAVAVALALTTVGAPLVAAQPGAQRAAVLALPPAPADGARPVLVSDDWRSVVNFYRATANLAPLSENRDWSNGAWLHSRYMTLNNVIAHNEVRGRPYFTAEGDAAARNGNVFLGSGMTFSDRHMIEEWMTGPFHGTGIIDPAMRSTGYGSFRSGDRTGATLDVLRGQVGYGPPSSPVVWPGDGMQVPVGAYTGHESPSPLTFCPGYPRVTGLPIMALLPSGVRATGSTITRSGSALTHCRFDAGSNGDAYARKILASRNAVVLMPRDELKPYTPYTVTLQTTSGTLTWTFTVGEVSPPRNVQLSGLQSMQTSPSFPLTWSAEDRESGIASYDVRYRQAPRGGSLGAVTAWQTGVTTTSATFSGQTGSTYCFSARAKDKAGNYSPWTAERCTALPLAASDLSASLLLWLPQADPGYYAGTAMLSLTPGSTLTVAANNVRRIAVLVSTCPGCGTLDVTFRGKSIGVVNLDKPSAHKVVVDVGKFANAWSGDVVLTATSSLKQVVVEGLGLAAA